MSNPIVIAELTKNKRETLRVGLGEFKGHQLLSIWTWYSASDGGELKPGKHGLSVNVGLLPDLRRALDQAEQKARELGLLSDGGSNAA